MILLTLLLAACPEPSAFVAALPKHAGIQCRFEQHKKSALFRKELSSKGQLWVSGQRLRFDGPNSSLTVNGSDVVMKSAGKTDKLSLSAAPRVEAFLATFSGLFVGKLETLDQSFDIKSACHGDKTSLLMTPKKDAVVKKLSLTFDGKRLERVDLVEPSGDEVALLLSACQFGAEAAPSSIFE